MSLWNSPGSAGAVGSGQIEATARVETAQVFGNALPAAFLKEASVWS